MLMKPGIKRNKKGFLTTRDFTGQQNETNTIIIANEPVC